MFNLENIKFDISKININSEDNFNINKENQEEVKEEVKEEIKEECNINDEINIKYLNPKYKDMHRSLNLCLNDLKNIVDSLEYFIKELKDIYDKQEDNYKKLSIEYKINKFTEISEKIKDEIKYCSKCNKKKNKKNDSVGYDPLLAGYVGVNDLDKD